jgi:hypothetical protein
MNDSTDFDPTPTLTSDGWMLCPSKLVRYCRVTSPLSYTAWEGWHNEAKYWTSVDVARRTWDRRECVVADAEIRRHD